MKTGSEEFAEALGRIDHAVAFFQSHPQVRMVCVYTRLYVCVLIYPIIYLMLRLHSLLDRDHQPTPKPKTPIHPSTTV